MASSRTRRTRRTPKVNASASAHVRALYRAIHAVVRRIPRGKVATYGQVAELAGIPGGARVAGAAMRNAKNIPWQRVLGKRGPNRAAIALLDPIGAAIQRKLLEREGIVLTDRGLIDLTRFGWLPAR